jgi:hypothetical protein
MLLIKWQSRAPKNRRSTSRPHAAQFFFASWKCWGLTRQQGDVDLQNLRAQEAAVAAAKHNVTAQENLVKQLRQDREYASVVAHFDGVITQRNVDVGSLV